jgi:hypothetical protein
MKVLLREESVSGALRMTARGLRRRRRHASPAHGAVGLRILPEPCPAEPSRGRRVHEQGCAIVRGFSMLRIVDRYIIRELLLPFLIGLLVFTFLLLIPPLADYGEQLIAKGVSWEIVAKVLLTLVPQSLAVTIPIALLIGLLIAFGRLSADRESSPSSRGA